MNGNSPIEGSAFAYQKELRRRMEIDFASSATVSRSVSFPLWLARLVELVSVLGRHEKELQAAGS
jgi:hypothetical protein